MCGRYSFKTSNKQLREELPDVELPPQLEISFNISPTHFALVVCNQYPLSLQKMEWGLVPYWSKDGKNTGNMINARSEGIEEKAAFKEPIRQRRCVVPADSFYEWRTEPGKQKTPYRIYKNDGTLLLMAGIWDEWLHNGQSKQSFSIITTSANSDIADLHNRMPVIFPSFETSKLWLTDLPLAKTLQLLAPLPSGLLSKYRVSNALNKAGYDSPDLHEKVEEPWRLF
jgi:putative SOS response-associated peptidase YedK